MERQLVVGFVCLELQDSCLSTQHAALEEIHCCDILIGIIFSSYTPIF